MASSQVLDPVVLEGLRVLDEETGGGFLRELVALFVGEIDGRLAHLDEAVARGDAAAIAGVTHGMKGSAANVGALRMRDAAIDLEAAARTGELDDAGVLVARLRDEFDRAHQALEAELS